MNVAGVHPVFHPRTCCALRAAALAGSLLAGLSGYGCASAPAKDPDRVNINDAVQRSADREFVREPFSDQARQGVIRQRTLYEVHFVSESSRLSALGRRDVSILADALRAGGGRISIRRGAAGEQLYAQRVAEVRRTLASCGIEPDRVSIDDRFPGGAGTRTEDALLIRSDIRAAPMPPISDAPVPPQGASSTPPGSTP